jgi:hypothetical protein
MIRAGWPGLLRFKNVAVPCVPHVESQQTAAGSTPSQPAVADLCIYQEKQTSVLRSPVSPAARREGDN